MASEFVKLHYSLYQNNINIIIFSIVCPLNVAIILIVKDGDIYCLFICYFIIARDVSSTPPMPVINSTYTNLFTIKCTSHGDLSNYKSEIYILIMKFKKKLPTRCNIKYKALWLLLIQFGHNLFLHNYSHRGYSIHTNV